ncbi:MAG: pyridoxamine 5'-phosphate oxidase family protein [Dehalococcoidia bacterium]
MFTDAEKEFIGTVGNPGPAGLAHIATATPDGKPHVVPLRAFMNDAGDKVLVLGNAMAQSYKYRQVQKNAWVAVVWDGHAGDSGYGGIRGIEVRGTAEIKWPEGDKDPHFEVTPTKVFSWGLNEPAMESFEKKSGMNMDHMRNRS